MNYMEVYSGPSTVHMEDPCPVGCHIQIDSGTAVGLTAHVRRSPSKTRDELGWGTAELQQVERDPHWSLAFVSNAVLAHEGLPMPDHIKLRVAMQRSHQKGPIQQG